MSKALELKITSPPFPTIVSPLACPFVLLLVFCPPQAKGIETVFFDRQSASHKYTYHGRVAAFVDGVREAGVVV